MFILLSYKAFFFLFAGIRALALRKLLRGLQPIGTFDPKYKNLVKTGDYDDALKDFKSLKPMNVVERKAESGVSPLRLNL